MKLLLLTVLVVAMAYQASAFDFELFRRDATCDREFGKCAKHLTEMEQPKNPNDLAEIKRMCGNFLGACENFSKIPSNKGCGGDLGKQAGPMIKDLVGLCKQLP